MRKLSAFRAGLAALGLLAFPAAAHAQATSPEALLGEIANRQAAEAAAFNRAVAEYMAASEGERRTLLEGSFARRDALAATSEGMAAQYTANETAILERNRELNAKAATLGLAEVFGVTRETAADVATILQQSVITTQYQPAEGELPRDEALRELAALRSMPRIPDIERLWVEMQREIVASGQVVRFNTAVVQPGGEPVDASVIRIGTFTATSDGRFLQNLPELSRLSVLPRQLPGEFMGPAGSFERATEGYQRAVVDPFRGVTTTLYTQRPTVMERIEQGEAIGYGIIVVGMAGFLGFLFQLFYLIGVRGAVGRQLKNLDRPRKDNPLGRVLLAFRGDPNTIEDDADIAELRIAEAVLHETPALERFQPFLRLCVAAGPLLGLIGTVVGMIITFQSITESGQSDPRLMASGIGQAMIATVLGLGIAIPLLFANALLNSLSRNVVQILDEQSAGMLAESLERKRGV